MLDEITPMVTLSEQDICSFQEGTKIAEAFIYDKLWNDKLIGKKITFTDGTNLVTLSVLGVHPFVGDTLESAVSAMILESDFNDMLPSTETQSDAIEHYLTLYSDFPRDEETEIGVFYFGRV
jgi:ASC-1-like (ASCH) protein